MGLAWISTIPFATQQGILAGLIVLVAAVAIARLLKRRGWAVIALLIMLPPLALGGFWWSQPNWGINDWDYYFTYHTAVRRTVMAYHQFPHWNPYICGGTSGIGDPEFPLFAPTFWLELAFGVPTGLRLAIYFAAGAGAIGMAALARRLRLGWLAALLAGLIWAYNSRMILPLVEGHTNQFTAAWIPWVLLCWLEAYRASLKLKVKSSKLIVATATGGWTILGGMFLALMFFQGYIHLLMYLAAALLGLSLLTADRGRALLVTTSAGVWFLGLSAIKFVPVILWLRQFQDKAYATSNFTLPWLHEILLGRHLHGATVITGQSGGWHEYGTYVGWIVLLLAVLGVVTAWRQRRVKILCITFAVALGFSTLGSFLGPRLADLPWLPRSNISRVALFSVVPLALLAGQGLLWIQQRWPKRPLLAAVFVGLVAVDLLSLSYPLSRQAFILEPVHPAPAAPRPPIEYMYNEFKRRHQGVDYSRTYAAALAGYGTMSYCSVISPPPAVENINDLPNTGLFELDYPGATYTIQSWTPEKVSVAVSTPAETNVYLNANYARGWTVNGHAVPPAVGARVMTKVSAGEHTLVFRYRAPGWTAGVTITFLTIVLAAGTLYHRREASPLFPARS